MRFKLFNLFVLVSVCSFSAAAQTVIEAASKAVIEEKAIAITLVVESDKNLGSISTTVELVDTAGLVRAQASEKIQSVKRGNQSLEFRLPLSDYVLSNKESIAWYRLRYRIGNSSGLISMSQLISGFFDLRVIAVESVFAGMTYRVRVRAVNPFSGEPLAGVTIQTEVDLNLTDAGTKQAFNGSGITDEAGFSVVDFMIPADSKLDEDGKIRVIGRKDNIVREAEQELDSHENDVQFISMTDKPIYQPEQTVNVRGILMKGIESKVVVPNSEVEFTVTDDDETVLYRENTRSSEFGIAAISWVIPTNARLGGYRIKFRDENDEEIGGEDIKVSRYDLPNFVVGAKAQKPYYLPDENGAEIEVKADYLFGKPVTSGKVRVVQENSREWNWKEQKYDIDEGQVREGSTDAQGKFTATLDLEDEQEKLKDDSQPYRDIQFAAYFTDLTTNKTEQRRFDIRITREPIHIYLIGETRDLNPKLPMNYYVSTFYADGTPAECSVEVQARKENAKKFKAYARLKTNKYGAGKLSMQRPGIGEPDDDLDFVVTATDKDRRLGKFEKNVSFDDDDQIYIATDRSIYKPGETMNVTITSTVRTGPLYLDVVNGQSVIDSRFAMLRDGKAKIQIPYNHAYKGVLTVAAFAEDEYDDIVRSSCGVIFPAKQDINVEASFDKALYKPGEEATVDYNIIDSLGQPVRSALGIVVLDKAVEERAATDESFGGRWQSNFAWLRGYRKGFGGLNVKDLNELDFTKPITKEMQLVGKIILGDSYYRPAIFHSNNYYAEAKAAFSQSTARQFVPIDAALKNSYANERYLHPVDDASFNSILERHKINFGQMLDPWGSPYKAKYSVEKARDLVAIISSGPDKQFETKDDFTAFTAGFDYFTETGKAIDAAVRNYNSRTGEFIRDERTLFSELGIDELLDRYGRPYRIVFEGENRYLKIRVRSGGNDGKFEEYDWRGDDFYVWTNQIDFFYPVEIRISNAQRSVKQIPMNEAEFRTLLSYAGVDSHDLLDGDGNPLYIKVEQTLRNWSKAAVETLQKFGESTRSERMVSVPVTQQIITFTIRGNGKDAKTGTYDDFTLMQVVHVLSEQSKVEPKYVTTKLAYSSSTVGSIMGSVNDANGAVIPNVTVIATNDKTKASRKAATNENGTFLITDLVPGTYTVNVPAALGFNASTITNVEIVATRTTELTVTLGVGAGVIVDVSADVSSIDATSTTISSRSVELLPKGLNFSTVLKTMPGTQPETRGGAFQVDGASGSENTFIIDGQAVTNVLSGTLEQGKANSTPRLREYFPETLFWAPEIVTEADGKAVVRFKMADTITTWKMYTIASTKTGKIGVAEKEVTAFQAFFADLDPPKFLTEGDEIYLPSQVRNYTNKKQKVDVTLDNAAWFTSLSPGKQQIEVEPNASKNAIFGFKAIAPVKDGKQRVTAIGQGDSDAIEKPVTVRPNGQEVVRTEKNVSDGSSEFEIRFPSNALPRTQQARLKIYPDLFAQVTDSVEGLLERPYGCGEQTISSTYPNLMILKFTKTDSPLRQKAKRYLQAGYERLKGYQDASGAFSYWGGKNSAPDLPLTAYAVRFLNDARSEIEVDENVIERAEAWLRNRQGADGSWTKDQSFGEDRGRSKASTAYVTRALSMRKDTRNSETIKKGLAYLRAFAAVDDAYGEAMFGLTALEAGDTSTAAEISRRLERSALKENGTIYWQPSSSTLFYGWGRAGSIETTALVSQLMMRTNEAVRKETISQALAFLFKNKDRYGVWHSTQATINVLNAFLTAREAVPPSQIGDIQIGINGRTVRTIPPSDGLTPIDIDITQDLNLTDDHLTVRGTRTLMAQLVLTHYVDWQDSEITKSSSPLWLDYRCDKPTAAIMEEINCSVETGRSDGRYGMLLAEIGTPPGADVIRESLEKAAQTDPNIGHYDILPDRIVLYLWTWNSETKFSFKFKPRYAINAQTPASIVYDYYNPEANATVAPLRFLVE